MTTAVMLGGPCHGLLILTGAGSGNGVPEMYIDVPVAPGETTSTPRQDPMQPRAFARARYTLRRVAFGGYYYWVYLSPGLLGTILTPEHFALIVDKHPTRTPVHES